MGRAFYSEAVRSCLQSYARNEHPVFQTEEEVQDWQACNIALRAFSPYKRKALLEVYRRYDTLEDNIYIVSYLLDIKQDTLWNLVSKLEKQVAINRGLL